MSLCLFFAINDFSKLFYVFCSELHVGDSLMSRYVHLLRIFCQPDKIFLIPTKYFQGFIQAGGVTVAGRAKQKIINVVKIFLSNQDVSEDTIDTLKDRQAPRKWKCSSSLNLSEAITVDVLSYKHYKPSIFGTINNKRVLLDVMIHYLLDLYA